MKNNTKKINKKKKPQNVFLIKTLILLSVLFIVLSTTLFGVLYGLRNLIFKPQPLPPPETPVETISDLKKCYLGNRNNYVEMPDKSIKFVINVDGDYRVVKGNLPYDKTMNNDFLAYDFSIIYPDLKECTLLHYNAFGNYNVPNGSVHFLPYTQPKEETYQLFLNIENNESTVYEGNYEPNVELIYFKSDEKYIEEAVRNIRPIIKPEGSVPPVEYIIEPTRFNNSWHEKNINEDFFIPTEADEGGYIRCHFFYKGEHVYTTIGMPFAGWQGTNLIFPHHYNIDKRKFLPDDGFVFKGKLRYCTNIGYKYYTFNFDKHNDQPSAVGVYQLTYEGVIGDDGTPRLRVKRFFGPEYTKMENNSYSDICFFYF